MSDSVEDEQDDALNLFQEPQDYYRPEKPATFTSYALQSGQQLSLRLVGSSPLWGHLLWNAGKVIAQYLESNADLVKDKTVLELGAGAGLPSLISAILGARQVVVTDYPDANLIENLQYNIDNCMPPKPLQNIVAEGYLWGNEASPLTTHLGPQTDTFDVLILADILFNHSEHEKLVRTVRATLKKDPAAKALVFFTPYRPWLLEKDLSFFDLAKTQGLAVLELFRHQMDEVMFHDDPGDEGLRRTVFGFEVSWA